MDWEGFVDLLGGHPTYLPPREIDQPPLLVLSYDGVALAEPLYEKIMPVLKLFGSLDIINMFNINGESLLSSLEEIIIGMTLNGIAITVPVFILCLTIAGFVSNKLAKSVFVSVGRRDPPETAIGILREYFGTDLIY